MKMIMKLAAMELILCAVLAADVAWSQEIKVERLEYSASMIFWLDNHRMLIATSKIADQRSGVRVPATLIVDTRDGTAKERPEVQRPVCYASGYFFYSRREGDVWIDYAGPFGAEREIRRWRKGDPVPEPKPYFNPLDCREYPVESLPRVGGEYFYPLTLQHGYLGPASEKTAYATKSRLLKTNGELVEIPIPTDLYGARRYSEYLESYFFDRNWSSRPGMPDTVRILKPDGKAEVVTITIGPWARGSHRYWPAKNGWFVLSHSLSLTPPHFPGDAGVHFISSGTVTRLVQGYPDPLEGAVSPDGCRFASSIRLRHGERAYLHVISLCDAR